MLTDSDRQRLKRAGFIPMEIYRYDAGVGPDNEPQPPIDLNSPLWQTAMQTRFEWMDDKRRRGWSDTEIGNEIANYYARGRKRTPWDFLKAEYRPPKRVDYIAAVRRRARRRARALWRL